MAVNEILGPPAAFVSAPLDPSERIFQSCPFFEARRLADHYRLTPQEARVLMLLAEDGADSKTIALRLDLSPRTVEIHTQNMLAKLGVKNRTHAALLWDRQFRAYGPHPVYSKPSATEVLLIKRAGLWRTSVVSERYQLAPCKRIGYLAGKIARILEHRFGDDAADMEMMLRMEKQS